MGFPIQQEDPRLAALRERVRLQRLEQRVQEQRIVPEWASQGPITPGQPVTPEEREGPRLADVGAMEMIPTAAAPVSTYGEESGYEPPPTEEAGIGKQAIAGWLQGILPLIQTVAPLSPLMGGSDIRRIQEERRKAEAVPKPQDPFQALARFGGHLGGEALPFAGALGLGGVMTRALAGKVSPAIARILGQTVAGGTLGAVQHPEEPGRGALRTGALFAGLGGLGEGAIAGVGALGKRTLRQRAAEEMGRTGQSAVAERLAADSAVSRAARRTGGAELAPRGAAAETEYAEALDHLIRTTEVATKPAAVPATQDYLNLARFTTGAEGKRYLEERIAAAVEQGQLERKVITYGQERKMAADMAGLTPDEIMAVEGVTAEARQLAMVNMLNENANIESRLAGRLMREGELMPAADKAILERQLAILDAETTELTSRVSAAGTEGGRFMNAQKILAFNSLEPAAWFVRANRILGRQNEYLGDEVRAEIMRLINRIHAGEGTREELARYVANLQRATRGEKAATLWKAGLLTSPTTHIANIFGNTSMALLETIKDPVALVFDRLVGMATGLETKAPTFRGLITEQWRGLGEGAAEGYQVMQGSPIGNMARRFDYYREVDYGNLFANTYTQGIFRALTAMDRPFRGMAVRRSLTERATLLGRKEGLRGADLRNRVTELLKNPTDEMSVLAIEEADYTTFMNQGSLGAIAQSFKRSLGTPVEFVIPFTMTPANIASRVAEYSPFGYLRSARDAGRLFKQVMAGAPQEALQKQLVEQLARSTVGMAPITMGFMLAKAGRMTGGYPMHDQALRAQWALEGKHENAVLIGDKWYSIERISPIGNLMALGATTHEVLSDPDKSIAEALGLLAMAIPQSVMEQSFLTGLRDAMNVMADPERNMKRYVNGFATSIIPNIVRRIAYGLDPVVRDAETLPEQFMQRLPGLSRGVPAQVNVLGQERTRIPGLGAALFDPFSTRMDITQQDPVVAELANIGASVSHPGKRKGESESHYRLRKEIYGRTIHLAISAAIQTAEYKGIGVIAEYVAGSPGRQAEEIANEQKRYLIEEMITQARRTLTRDLAELDDDGLNIVLESLINSTRTGR